MIKISNKNYKLSDILARVGSLNQIYGTRHYELTEGNSKGTRAIDVDTGSGFRYTILPDRGMDISLASYKGMNLVYLTENGEVNPSYYNPMGTEWLRVFFAGLLTTCGLTHFGEPVIDGTESLGMHGRYSGTPAKQVNDSSCMVHDECWIVVSGVVQDSVLFGHKLRSKRTIRSKCGSKYLMINDEIENMISQPAPFNIMYHINFGFPLLDENARIYVKSSEMSAYDELSEKEKENWNIFSPPSLDFCEQNFLHNMIPDDEGNTYAVVTNKALKDPIGVYIKFNAIELPFMSQWKMCGEKDYVLALEPCNTKAVNRKILRNEGILPIIGPCEKKNIELEIGILDGIDEISEFISKRIE